MEHSLMLNMQKNIITNLSKENFSGEGHTSVINTFIENDIDIMQKIISPIIGEKSARIRSPNLELITQLHLNFYTLASERQELKSRYDGL